MSETKKQKPYDVMDLKEQRIDHPFGSISIKTYTFRNGHHDVDLWFWNKISDLKVRVNIDQKGKYSITNNETGDKK